MKIILKRLIFFEKVYNILEPNNGHVYKQGSVFLSYLCAEPIIQLSVMFVVFCFPFFCTTFMSQMSSLSKHKQLGKRYRKKLNVVNYQMNLSTVELLFLQFHLVDFNFDINTILDDFHYSIYIPKFLCR